MQEATWHRGPLRLLALLALTVGCAAACSSAPGPPPLSRLLEKDDLGSYLRHLEAESGAGIRAHFAWKAEKGEGTVDELARADAAVSIEKNPFRTDDRGALKRGAIVFKAHCARCHGEGADGRGPEMEKYLPAMDFHSSSRRFAAANFGGTPRKWFLSVLRGKTSSQTKADGSPYAMPAFDGALAREQIWLAVNYLLSADADFPLAAAAK